MMLNLVVYSANTGVPPDHDTLPANVRWEQNDAPNVPAPTTGATSATILPSGVLHISDTDENQRHIYARFDHLDPSDDAVFEINCRVQPVPHDNSYGVAFGFIDTEKFLEVGLFGDAVYVPRLESAGGEVRANVDIGVFHTYRIVKNGATNMQVFVDGVMVLEVPHADLWDSDVGFERQVISTSGHDFAEWDITYVAYSIS